MLKIPKGFCTPGEKLNEHPYPHPFLRSDPALTQHCISDSWSCWPGASTTSWALRLPTECTRCWGTREYGEKRSEAAVLQETNWDFGLRSLKLLPPSLAWIIHQASILSQFCAQAKPAASGDHILINIITLLPSLCIHSYLLKAATILSFNLALSSYPFGCREWKLHSIQKMYFLVAFQKPG